MLRTLLTPLLALLLVGCTPTMEMGTPSYRHALQGWQGYCVRVGTVDEVTASAEKLGKESWELVSVTSVESQFVACFKRPRGR
jgi:hypothetical protein